MQFSRSTLCCLILLVAAGCGSGGLDVGSSSDDIPIDPGNTGGAGSGGGGVPGGGGFQTFIVRDGGKPATHPAFNIGCPCSFWINNQSGVVLNLNRGATYQFEVFAPGHSFYFTTHPAGGPGSPGRISSGVLNDLVDVGTVTFTPGQDLPGTVYYQDAVDLNMGWEIRLTP